jgi:hypothetical protein
MVMDVCQRTTRQSMTIRFGDCQKSLKPLCLAADHVCQWLEKFENPRRIPMGVDRIPFLPRWKKLPRLTRWHAVAAASSQMALPKLPKNG